MRGLGCFWGLELVKNRETREPLVPFNGTGEAAKPVAALAKDALSKGLYLMTHWNVVMVCPPLTITRDELDEGIAILDEALSVADEFVVLDLREKTRQRRRDGHHGVMLEPPQAAARCRRTPAPRRASGRASRSSTAASARSSSPRSSVSCSSRASRARRRRRRGRRWKPATSSTADMTKQIADTSRAEYKLDSAGDQLLAIVPSKPEITRNTKVSDVSTIAIRTSASSQNFSRIIPTKGNSQVQLCGLGSECAIDRGTATAARERLIRREALELALYTFKYVPSVNALIAYMPPPPGQTP